MELQYNLVLFDLDGTLIDTLEDLAEAVNHALRLRGYPLHSLEEYRRMVGHGVRNLVKQALPEAQQADEALIDIEAIDNYPDDKIVIPGRFQSLLHGPY